MNTVKVRNLELGNGIPAICILMLERQKKTSFPYPYISWHAYGSDGMADGLVRRC